MKRLMTLTALVGIAAIVAVPGAGAKLRPAFGQRTAEVGETVRLHLGAGANLIPPPIEIQLVPLEQSVRMPERRDPASVTVARITARLDAERRYVEVIVPSVAEGEYTAAIWFKGDLTGSWLNGAAAFRPLLTVETQDSLNVLAWAAIAAAMIALVVASSVFWLKRRPSRLAQQQIAARRGT